MFEYEQNITINDPIYDQILEDEYTLTLIDGSPIPPFIRIRNNVIKVSSNNLENSGRYIITYKGCTGIKLAIL